MRVTLFLILSLLCIGRLNAQFQVLGTSTIFEEPRSGYVKLIKDKEGNTYYLRFENKGKITLKCYDTNRKMVYDKAMSYETESKKVGSPEGIYIMNGQMVILLNKLEDKEPTLLRLILDLKSGTLKSQTVIATLDKMDMGKGYAMAFGDVPYPDFYVRKSETSDDYAICLFNSFAADRNQRIKLLYYNGHHELLSEAFYESPNEAYKYMELLDLYVDGSKGVYVAAMGKNTPKSGGDQSGGLFIGKLEPGKKSFDMEKVSFNSAKLIVNVFLRYNAVTDKFMMIINKANTEKDLKKQGKIKVFMTTFDKDLSNFESKMLNLSSLNRVAKSKFKEKESVTAIPSYLKINTDGSYVICLEEAIVKVSSYSTTGRGGIGSTHNSTKYYLNDIGVIKYNKDDSIMAVNYIPKSQMVAALPGGLYYSFKSERGELMNAGSQFKSYMYIDAPKNDYILFNDIAQNQEKMQKGKRVTTIQGLGDCQGYYYKVDKKGIPEGQLVMENQNKKERHLMLFSVGYYDTESNEYVILKKDRQGREEGVVLLWLQPE